MEGKYFVKEHDEPIEKHEHVIFEFEDGLDLRYADVRKFGRMCLVEKSKIEEYEPVHKQGLEPIDDKLSGEYIYEHFKDKKIPIKTLLLDQTIIAGLGNIYADEVAHRAKVNPLKLGTEIKKNECNNELSPYHSTLLSELERVADHLTNVGYSIINPTGDEKAHNLL